MNEYVLFDSFMVKKILVDGFETLVTSYEEFTQAENGVNKILYRHERKFSNEWD